MLYSRLLQASQSYDLVPVELARPGRLKQSESWRTGRAGACEGRRSNQSRSVACAQRCVPEAQRHEEATDFALTCAVDTGFVSHRVEVDDDGSRNRQLGSVEDDGKAKARARNRRRRVFGQRVGAGLATLGSRAGRASLAYAPPSHRGARRRSHAELGLGPGGGIRRWCEEEGRRRAHGWPAAS